MKSTLHLPALADDGSPARVCRLHAVPGQAFGRGAGLLDISVTLGGSEAHDCPPITHFRLHAREAATLMQWHVQDGDIVQGGAILATLELSAPDGTAPGRGLRLTVAGIVPDDDF